MIEDLNNYIDATILDPKADSFAYSKLCNDAIAYNITAVCVPPFMVDTCRKILNTSNVKVATVVGFPSGYQTIPSKLYELKELIDRGAQEIDYVIHRGYLSDNDFENVEEETLSWISLCKDCGVISKWIIEASELSKEQFDRILQIANKFNPDFVKTSTGVFGKASLEIMKYMREHLDSKIKIKAAGGIVGRDIAIQYIEVGADRLGVSNYQSMLE